MWNTIQLWTSEIQQKLTSRDPVTLPALEIEPFRQHTRSLSLSPSPESTSPSSYIPPLINSSHSLKRPFEAKGGDEIWENEKRFKASDDCPNQKFIVIDD
ncbi:hypothetical protein DL98DRAFT_516761 [Cadophora sp. DSE1049]|nr:hypothetical protein DL98DRAFT_516761 [Cadophora sp. DSE1049]